MTWTQREARTPFPDSGTTEYRGCLDSLIATIADMKAWPAPLYDTHRWHDIQRAQERAAHCAHMLFERWVEVRDDASFCRKCSKERAYSGDYRRDGKPACVGCGTLWP